MKMKYFYSFTLTLFTAFSFFAQSFSDDASYNSNSGTVGGASSIPPLNMQQIGYLDLVSMHNSDLSDIWGWSTGSNEYAIVGLNDGTSIVDVTNPQQKYFMNQE